MKNNDDYSKDWFCRCCVNYFKRTNPRLIRKNAEWYQQYLSTGLCDECQKEINAGTIEEQISLLKNDN